MNKIIRKNSVIKALAEALSGSIVGNLDVTNLGDFMDLKVIDGCILLRFEDTQVYKDNLEHEIHIILDVSSIGHLSC